MRLAVKVSGEPLGEAAYQIGMLHGMGQQIAVRLSNEDLLQLDAAVNRGEFASRAEAVRAGLELVLARQREREIAEEYRRAYAEQPQEPWVGEVGASLMGEALAEREREAQ